MIYDYQVAIYDDENDEDDEDEDDENDDEDDENDEEDDVPTIHFVLFDLVDDELLHGHRLYRKLASSRLGRKHHCVTDKRYDRRGVSSRGGVIKRQDQGG